MQDVATLAGFHFSCQSVWKFTRAPSWLKRASQAYLFAGPICWTSGKPIQPSAASGQRIKRVDARSASHAGSV
jgi:hypothetical protein